MRTLSSLRARPALFGAAVVWGTLCAPMAHAQKSLGLGLTTGVFGQGAAASKVVIARVNGVDILRSEMERQVAALPKEEAEGLTDPKGYQREGVLRSLVDDELLVQYARKQGVVPSSAQIDTELGKVRGKRSKAAFADTLKARGLTAAGVRNQIERRLLIAGAVETLPTLRPPSAKNVRAAYDADKDAWKAAPGFRIQQIHFVSKKAPTASIQKAAKQAAAEVRAPGANFAMIAARYHKLFKTRGGDAVEITMKQVPKSLQHALFTAKDGTILGPLQSPYGVHVIQVIRRLPGRTLSFEAVKKSVRDQIVSKRRYASVIELLIRLEKEAKIDVIDKQLVLRPHEAGTPQKPAH